MTIFTESAPAKINLTLEVLGRRADGYHELRSLVAFARDAADQIALDTARPVGCDVTGPFGATIAGQNLIDATLAKLAAADPELTLGHVTLTKNLPVAAGIGGGSADAAAVLRAVRRANPDRAAGIDWHAIALSLGADVPVCFASVKAMIGGIGDIVDADGSFSLIPALLVNPLLPMPADKTAQVFRRLAAPALRVPSDLPPVCVPSFEGPRALIAYMAARPNALGPPALEVVPGISEIKTALAQTKGARIVRMSGGGPTCFALYDDWQATVAAAAEIAAAHPIWWVEPTRLL